MGFARTPQRHVIDRARGAPFEALITAEDLAIVIREADPFLIPDNICLNPAGHLPIAACGEVVCAHCARIFWRRP